MLDRVPCVEKSSDTKMQPAGNASASAHSPSINDLHARGEGRGCVHACRAAWSLPACLLMAGHRSWVEPLSICNENCWAAAGPAGLAASPGSLSLRYSNGTLAQQRAPSFPRAR